MKSEIDAIQSVLGSLKSEVGTLQSDFGNLKRMAIVGGAILLLAQGAVVILQLVG